MQTATTITEREAEIAAAGGVIGATIGIVMAFSIVFYVLTIIATWRILKKAGQPGWKCLIPIYNVYMLYKIVGMPGWFWGLLLVNILLIIVMNFDHTLGYFIGDANQPTFDAGAHIPTVIALAVAGIVSLCGGILYAWRTSKAFGHGVGFFLGLFFLQPLFWLIIGFGKSKYNKKAIRR